MLYASNISPIVTEEDLYARFDFQITSYRQKTCKSELYRCFKTGSFMGIQLCVIMFLKRSLN